MSCECAVRSAGILEENTQWLCSVRCDLRGNGVSSPSSSWLLMLPLLLSLSLWYRHHHHNHHYHHHHHQWILSLPFFMWLNVYLGKVNLETCWPAVYLMGRPTCPQGLLVTHVLAGPALLHSPNIADQSQASWPLCSPPFPPTPSPSVSMFLASLHWFCSVTGAVVLGGHRVATATASVGHYLAFGGPSIITHLPIIIIIIS